MQFGEPSATMLPDAPERYRVRISIRYWVASWEHAELGEIVYGPLLTADPKFDDKGEPAERFEATKGQKVFHPEPGGGWRRVN